jgi:type IV pilus assembly protein PilA
MFCSQCGTTNADGAQFCSKCGAGLGNTATSAAGLPVAPGAPVVAQPAVGVPARRSGMATASLLFGIFFFILPASIAAIIFGHLSLSEIRKSAGRLTGHGTAMAGLILGYIGVAIIPFILIVAAIAIPNLLRAKMAANQASSVGSLRTIIAANETYSSEFGNGFATSLDQLDGSGSGTGNCEHAGLLDHVLASGQKSGYVFTYSAKPSSDPAAKGCAEPGASGFSVNADPVNRNTTGQSSFYTDETGVIRIEKSGPASADSEILQ